MSEVTLANILCIDDEQNVLDALKRQLRNVYTVDTALGCKPALELIKNKTYSVVISDMRMPEIDGIECLSRIKKVSPDSVRIMLTGNADQESAIRGVNEGNIFRFLSKPCPTEQLKKAISDAHDQYQLVIAEKELLQKTLRGSVKLLTDIISLTDSGLTENTAGVQQIISKLKETFNFDKYWETEIAAMVYNIGLITAPPDTILKIQNEKELSRDEMMLMEQLPSIGQSLIENIPRLEGVGKIVLYQNKNFDGTSFPDDKVSGEALPIGARLLKIAKDLSRSIQRGIEPLPAIAEMKSKTGFYDPDLLDKIAHVYKPLPAEPILKETEIFEISHKQLLPGQKLLSNIETAKGLLLISSGSVLTSAMLARISNYARIAGLREPIKVDCLTPVKE